MSKLKFEIVHFLVILVLLLLNIGGCGGQPLCSKSILNVVSQMVRLCNYGTALIFNVHIGFLTFQDHLYLSYQTGTPCTFKFFYESGNRKNNATKYNFFWGWNQIHIFFCVHRPNSCCVVPKWKIDFQLVPIPTMATSVSFPLNGHAGISVLEKVTFAISAFQRKKNLAKSNHSIIDRSVI